MTSLHAPDDSRREYRLADAAATAALGTALAAVLPREPKPAAVIALTGDLGAGKTTLVAGLLHAFDKLETVKSPSYTVVEVHVISGLHFYHFDFFRFDQPEEFLDAGLDEYFGGAGVCLVEWPEKAVPYLPAADLAVRLEYEHAGRRATIEANSERGRQWLARLTMPPGGPSSPAGSA